MLAKKIESLQHPKVIHWAKLLKEGSYRKEKGSVLVSGEKLIRELNVKPACLMTLKETDIAANEKFIVTEAILKKITGLKAPDGFAAEIPLPPPQDLSTCQNLLILDGLQDPGNLGTLIRTAYALGWDGVIATPGTVDFFNDKAIRAAQGATFRLPLAILPPETFNSWKFSFYIADLNGEPLSQCTFTTPKALILGSEGQGLSPWAKDLGKKIHIPMRKEAESLNVASAGSILLYAMRPQ